MVTDTKSLLEKQLSTRGVDTSSITETRTPVELPVVPAAPAIPPEQTESFFQKHYALLETLDIDPQTKVKTIKHTLSFQEHKERYRQENGTYIKNLHGTETLSYYEFGSSTQKPCVWLLFCHGGKIHPDVIGSSSYLPIVSIVLPKVKIAAVNHRGTQSKEAMSCYTLTDRITDLYMAYFHLISIGSIATDDIVIGFGDSMGGHVISTTTQLPSIFDALILTEPAAYTLKAQDLPFKELHDYQENVPPNEVTFTETIRSNPPTDSLALEAAKVFCKENKDFLLAFVEADKKLDAGPYFVPHLYQAIAQASLHQFPNAIREIVNYSGIHGDTTLLEIQSIKHFIYEITKKYGIYKTTSAATTDS